MMIRNGWNGDVAGYLLGPFRLRHRPPLCKVAGYIEAHDGVRYVLQPPWLLLLLPLILCATVSLASRTSEIVVYYPVCFAPQPYYSESILYCNIYNESDHSVVIQFAGQGKLSEPFLLESGCSLPYLYLPFTPETVLYDGTYAFSLEVKS